jgi:DivIVA domain-containing protein
MGLPGSPVLRPACHDRVMATLLLVLVVLLVLAALVFGVVTLLSGDDPGLSTAEPDGRARPLPNNRSLTEADLKDVRFDLAVRGYRMGQVDRVLRRTAYDLGYKDEMIAVLEAEVAALREGRQEDAELLRKARESAASTLPTATGDTERAEPAEPAEDEVAEDGPRHARPVTDAEDETENSETGGSADVLLGDFRLPGKHTSAVPSAGAEEAGDSKEAGDPQEAAERTTRA